MTEEEFRSKFAEGEEIASGGPRSRLRIQLISDAYVSVVPVFGRHQIPMRLYYDQLQAVVEGFEKIDPRRIAPTIQPVFVGAGLRKEHTTENYLYGFAREWLVRSRAQPLQEFPDEISEGSSVWKGAKRQVSVNVYERDASGRRICIGHWKAKCVVCGMTFKEVYGMCENFIHVHHLVPLSEIGREYRLDPIKDLRPVCPNCHAMIHSRKPIFSPDELRALLFAKQ